LQYLRQRSTPIRPTQLLRQLLHHQQHKLHLHVRQEPSSKGARAKNALLERSPHMEECHAFTVQSEHSVMMESPVLNVQLENPPSPEWNALTAQSENSATMECPAGIAHLENRRSLVDLHAQDVMPENTVLMDRFVWHALLADSRSLNHQLVKIAQSEQRALPEHSL